MLKSKKFKMFYMSSDIIRTNYHTKYILFENLKFYHNFIFKNSKYISN